MKRACPVCGTMTRRDGNWIACFACFDAVIPVRNLARARLLSAQRRGEMPHPGTLPCADCARPAQCYDHRDYDRPLDVAPVCRSCNQKRGPAKQLTPGYRIAA